MKDWSIVGIIIGIVVILGVGIGEQIYLEHFSNDMVSEVSKVESLIYSGNIEAGAKMLQDTLKKWEKYEEVLGNIIDHQDTRKITLAFIEVENKLKNFIHIEDISTNFALLKDYIINIERENKFTTANVL